MSVNRTRARLGLSLCVCLFTLPACLFGSDPANMNRGGDAGGADVGLTDSGVSDTGLADAGGECSEECGFAERCVDGACQACPETPATSECMAEGLVCTGDLLGRCSIGPDGCPELTVDTDCAAQDGYCQDGACVQCPDASGCTEETQLTCTPEGLRAECVRDAATGCLVADPFDQDNQCLEDSFCDMGECVACEDAGVACEDDGELACDDTEPGVVRRCQEQNGCLVALPDPDLACDLGSVCDPEDPEQCESCVEPGCEGKVVNDKARCLDGEDPRAFSFCQDTGNGCLVEVDTGACGPREYCNDEGDGPECLSCIAAFPGRSCMTPDLTRCDPSAPGQPSKGIQVCSPDPATGCLVWTELEECADGVCVPRNELANPLDMSTAVTEPTCVDNTCDAFDEQSCSPEGNPQRCAREATTGLLYQEPLDDCSSNEFCGDGPNGTKECQCNRVCELGDSSCSTSGITQVCGQSPIGDGCLVFVEETVNRCNYLTDGDGIACNGQDQIQRCRQGADGCRRPLVERCPCTIGVLCTDCQQSGTHPNGSSAYVCQ